MSHHAAFGYAVLAVAALVLLRGLQLAVRAIRHPPTCGCPRCDKRRRRREAAQWRYQERRYRQAVRRSARAAARAADRSATDRLITDLREYRDRVPQRRDEAAP